MKMLSSCTLSSPLTPVGLIILDGFGYQRLQSHNAIQQAHTPMLDQFTPVYLKASGTAVGLPRSTIGNSEVGHLTIGAGRIIKQPLTIFNDIIKDQNLCKHPVLKKQLPVIKESGGTLHCIGLLSDGGVHSHLNHLFALITCAHKAGIKRIVIHAILDGRDTPPRSALHYLKQLNEFIDTVPGAELGSIHGRYYAMDRDNHLDRTQKSFDVLTTLSAHQSDWHTVITKAYREGIRDEFITPHATSKNSHIKPGDSVIFFNFREDRIRQLARLIQALPLTSFITATRYAPSIKSHVLIERPRIKHTLFDILSAYGKSLYTIAETEKYAHVTYFFNGGRETRRENETRVLIPSLKVRDYIKHPEMSAQEITDAVVTSLSTQPRDFYLINYANPDMVGHSGNETAAIHTIEIIDAQIARLYEAFVTQLNGMLIITSDHGNAEEMWDEIHDQPHTQHTTNQVPFYVITRDGSCKAHIKTIAEIAPLILSILGLPVPKCMRE